MIHLITWRKSLGREFDFDVSIMARCGETTGERHATSWPSDVSCVPCLTGPYLGTPDVASTHGAREKAWFR